MTRLCSKHTLRGSIEAPPSKSSQQRAIACAALAEGESRICGTQLCADSNAALRLAESIGARTRSGEDSIFITGSEKFGETGKEESGPLELDCGESGLCMRMFSPVAALLDTTVVMKGGGSLAGRPMSMVADPLCAMGVSCSTSGGRAPLQIHGPLRGGDYSLDAGESSQFLTGLLVALPLARGNSTLRVSRLASRGYIDLTIETCRVFGVSILRDQAYTLFTIAGGQRYRAAEFRPEGDWSGSAFLVAAAALAARADGIEIRGLRSDSSQPDRAVLEAASRAGVPFRLRKGSLWVGRGSLVPFEFDATDCPDLFPPLAALAAACPGRSILYGTHRLASKESDRAKSLAACFSSLGAGVELSGDRLLIEGGTLHGGRIDACGDHRIAMAAAIAALGASEDVVVEGAECVAKSWPSFFEDLDGLTG